MNGSVLRRASSLGGLLIVAGLLTGCGEAEALPKNLCDLVGGDLTEIVPGAVIEPPYRSKRYGLNTISCEAASPVDASRKGHLHVVLERHGPCTSLRRGETVCNPRETNAESSFESQCESLLINPERYGREVTVNGLGQQACGAVADLDKETMAHIVAQDEGDVVHVTYTVKPPRDRKHVMDGARVVVKNVLNGLGS